jgi:hypothetical protein
MAFQQYRRTQIAEMEPWGEGYDMTHVSVSAPDKEAGSPKPGDMIARNPKNHGDKWLVAARYFADNFEPLGPSTRWSKCLFKWRSIMPRRRSGRRKRRVDEPNLAKLMKGGPV